MRPKTGNFGRAYGMPKTPKFFRGLPAFRPIVDTTSTPHYNPLTLNHYNLRDSFGSVSAIIPFPKSFR